MGKNLFKILPLIALILLGACKKTVEVANITLDKTSVEINPGATVKVTASITPDNATDKEIIWSSSDSKIATVNDGVITAVAVGNADITAKAGIKSATCKVSVVPLIIPVTEISLDKTSAEIEIGKTITLSATVTPDDASDKTVTWTTSDAKIATVANGVVTAVSAGSATITAAAGEKNATCAITVKADPADDVKGNYSLEEGAFEFNDSEGFLMDYPEASVKFDSRGGENADVTLTNIILGEPTCVVPVVVTRTKASGEFSFQGEATHDKTKTAVSGTIIDGKMSIKINTAVTENPIVNKWMIGEREVEVEVLSAAPASMQMLNLVLTKGANQASVPIKVPDVYFKFTPPDGVTEFNILGKKLPIAPIVAMIDQFLPTVAMKYPFRYIEYSADGYVNLSATIRTEDGSIETEEIFHNMIQYYTGDNMVNFYLRNSVMLSLKEIISGYYSGEIPSPFTFPVPYFMANENYLSFPFTNDYLNTLLGMLQGKIKAFTFQEFYVMLQQSGYLNDAIALAIQMGIIKTPEEFNEQLYEGLKAQLLGIFDVILRSKYTIGVNMIPYVEGNRPWIK